MAKKTVNVVKLQGELYFTSNEEIKEGDWMIDLTDSKLYQNKLALTKEQGDGHSLHKVIATSDKSLNLPLIPQSFIEEYVKSNGEIKEVNITYYTEEAFTLSRDSDGEQEVVIEEKKQTLEEAAHDYDKYRYAENTNISPQLERAFIAGAKWQQSNS